MSLMRRHQERMKQAGTVDAATPVVAVLGSATSGMVGMQQLVALLDAALAEDLKSLHDIQSVERKIEVKRTLLIPKYRDYVARLRADGRSHDLLGYYMVWLLDAGDMEAALELGFSLAAAGASMPERFKQQLPTFLAGTVMDWAEAEDALGRSPEPYFSELFAKAIGGLQDEPWDLPDALRARYYRMRGLLDEKTGDIPSAIEHLERAFMLGAKVKTKLDALKKTPGNPE